MIKEITSRSTTITATELFRRYFSKFIIESTATEAVFLQGNFNNVFGISGLPVKAPVLNSIFQNSDTANFFNKYIKTDSVAIIFLGESLNIYVKHQDEIEKINYIPKEVEQNIINVIESSKTYAGELNEKGEHIINLKNPAPGPHFSVNMLMGNTIELENALQIIPKSVVDRLGGGSFRSHAATQVLATRWDVLQEENGFPANRQFYILEDGKQIFYSANPTDENIESAYCTHSQNSTVIKYTTKCGLSITRTINLLPYKEGLPVAIEVQRIEFVNNSDAPRNLRLVYTGMFGINASETLMEDVLYSNIIAEARIFTDEEGNILAIAPNCYTEGARRNVRFNTMMLHNNDGKGVQFPQEFCTNYSEFIGNGNLYKPQGANRLSNKIYRKGPGFFAVSNDFLIGSHEKCTIDNFTGNILNDNDDINKVQAQIINLLDSFKNIANVDSMIADNTKFYQSYKQFFQIKTKDESLNTYVNNNLPFQVLYQTFVSRSFDQTQKGYRQIGFREIQDLYASMYYFVGMGMSSFVKKLLREWCVKIFEFGYAYHNFFWVGKEPGKWSDDALWFIQAVHRYVFLSGDSEFLNEECEVAGTDPVKVRTVYDTMKAIITYSGEISTGKHGMPLLDFADWNDCLKLDDDFIKGPEKEKLYMEQINNGGSFGEPLASNYSESVMNAFLLKLAEEHMMEFARLKEDTVYENKLKELINTLSLNIQKHAWKENFFARVLFNRGESSHFSYLGAKGDGLSADPSVDGSYFLNSFSWSVLSNTAKENQIEAMVNVIEDVLKTPFGIKLMSPCDLGKIAKGTATGEYFMGDRENGGVFKHACMMATAAMFKASKEVSDEKLALRLSRLAYWMVDLVLPYNTMKDPYVMCGNPRFCTQYNNSQTGENIGPTLSGTSTWLTLTLLSAFGVEWDSNGIKINPVLREKDENVSFAININNTKYKFNIIKPNGFYRMRSKDAVITFDGGVLDKNVLPVHNDGLEHNVTIQFA